MSFDVNELKQISSQKCIEVAQKYEKQLHNDALLCNPKGIAEKLMRDLKAEASRAAQSGKQEACVYYHLSP